MRTFCIITIRANELVADIHDRMAVIIPPESFDHWLSTLDPDPHGLLVPCPAAAMKMWPISTRVKSLTMMIRGYWSRSKFGKVRPTFDEKSRGCNFGREHALIGLGNPRRTSMRSGLLLLSAAALSAIMLSPPPSADARGARSAKYDAYRADAGPRRSSRKARRAVTPRPRMASAKRPGSCGTFMYWKDGRCNDARNKK